MDLTKIDKPFGELDDETAAALFLFARGGGYIQMKKQSSWVNLWGLPMWGEDIIYRAAPEPVTPDIIDWSHVAEKWKYMARDASGSVYFYGQHTEKEDSQWITDGDFSRADVCASYRRGTCDWRDSLVMRPGVEDAK